MPVTIASAKPATATSTKTRSSGSWQREAKRPRQHRLGDVAQDFEYLPTLGLVEREAGSHGHVIVFGKYPRVDQERDFALEHELQHHVRRSAADRLLGARWLADEKHYAPADSLLRFTRGGIITGTAEAAWPIFAAAQLLRSEIAEAMGNREDAIAFASIFLASYDLAPPAHKPLLDEARQRITRLGGRLDAPKAQPVR